MCQTMNDGVSTEEVTQVTLQLSVTSPTVEERSRHRDPSDEAGSRQSRSRRATWDERSLAGKGAGSLEGSKIGLGKFRLSSSVFC